MDALSEILRSIKLRSSVYFRADFHSPWGMEIDDGPYAQFHMVVRGHCWLKWNGVEEPLALSAGDVLLFPRGSAHWLADDPRSKRLPGRQIAEAIRHQEPAFQGERVSTTLVCGHFEFDRGVDHPFLSSLPEASWTLEDIARSVGMSRSSFAASFKELVETTPMDYITNWRMQKARELLEGTRLPLLDVAERGGYTSEAAFNRAFKRRFKQNPGAMRRALLPARN